MDLNKIIGELLDEKKRLDHIVESLEKLLLAQKEPASQAESKRGRKSMDAKARDQVSKRMKKYWAAQRAKRAKS